MKNRNAKKKDLKTHKRQWTRRLGVKRQGGVSCLPLSLAIEQRSDECGHQQQQNELNIVNSGRHHTHVSLLYYTGSYVLAALAQWAQCEQATDQSIFHEMKLQNVLFSAHVTTHNIQLDRKLIQYYKEI